MGRKIIMQHWISKNPVMTFTFEIKIWFKVTAHLLSTSTVHVKYKLDTAMERYNMVETRILLVWYNLDLEMCFKVTAYSLPTGTMCVRYAWVRLGQIKERKICLASWTIDVRWTGRLITIRCQQSMQGCILQKKLRLKVKIWTQIIHYMIPET